MPHRTYLLCVAIKSTENKQRTNQINNNEHKKIWCLCGSTVGLPIYTAIQAFRKWIESFHFWKCFGRCLPYFKILVVDSSLREVFLIKNARRLFVKHFFHVFVYCVPFNLRSIEIHRDARCCFCCCCLNLKSIDKLAAAAIDTATLPIFLSRRKWVLGDQQQQQQKTGRTKVKIRVRGSIATEIISNMI